MPSVVRQCPGCRDKRTFDTPPCVDGHGADCAELACCQCGAALVVPVLVELPLPRRSRSALGAAA